MDPGGRTDPRGDSHGRQRGQSQRQVRRRDLLHRQQGVGIPTEWHGRIFERFSRFAEGGVNRPAGLGLGLSISRDLAELNGGVLLLERSALGEGSVFVFRLPAVSS